LELMPCALCCLSANPTGTRIDIQDLVGLPMRAGPGAPLVPLGHVAQFLAVVRFELGGKRILAVLDRQWFGVCSVALPVCPSPRVVVAFERASAVVPFDNPLRAFSLQCVVHVVLHGESPSTSTSMPRWSRALANLRAFGLPSSSCA